MHENKAKINVGQPSLPLPTGIYTTCMTIFLPSCQWSITASYTEAVYRHIFHTFMLCHPQLRLFEHLLILPADTLFPDHILPERKVLRTNCFGRGGKLAPNVFLFIVKSRARYLLNTQEVYPISAHILSMTPQKPKLQPSLPLSMVFISASPSRSSSISKERFHFLDLVCN